MPSYQSSRRVEYDGYSLTDLDPKAEPTIKVLVPSLIPGALTGPVSAGEDTKTTSFFDPSNAKQQESVTTSNYILAYWEGKSNSKYAPLVRYKEQVTVYQIGNSDKFYWEPKGRDSNLRTLERHREEISATPVVGQENTDDNTYYRETNSVEGYVRSKTSKANGEPFAYISHLDTKNGTFTFSDDKSSGMNKIFVDSNNNIIHASNGDGVTVHLEGRNLSIEVPDSLTIKAGKQIYLDSPIITLNKDQSGVIVFNSKSMTLNGSNYIGNFTTFGLNGTVKVSGPLVANGIRSPSYVNGPVGEAYASSSTNPVGVSAVDNNNNADSNVAGDGNRHAAAYEQVAAAFEATAKAIQDVAKQAKVSASTGDITSNGNNSKMTNLKGD